MNVLVNLYFYFLEADNLLGFSKREARLADRVREVEEQNLILRRQLSISQNQLVSLISDAQSKKNGQALDDNSNFTASLLPPGLRTRKQHQGPCREVSVCLRIFCECVLKLFFFFFWL